MGGSNFLDRDLPEWIANADLLALRAAAEHIGLVIAMRTDEARAAAIALERQAREAKQALKEFRAQAETGKAIMKELGVKTAKSKPRKKRSDAGTKRAAYGRPTVEPTTSDEGWESL